MQTTLLKFLTIFFLSFLLYGCGSSDNEPRLPTANAGADQTVDELTLVTLRGSASSPDGSIRSYEWTQTSGIAVSLANGTTATATFTASDVKPDQTLTFRLKVVDSHGNSATDTTNVVIRHLNSPPMVDAGVDREVKGNEEISIYAFATDNDGTVVSYAWEQLSGPAVTLEANTTDTVKFVTPSLAEAANIELKVTVTDDEGATGSDTIVISVAPMEFTITALNRASANVGDKLTITTSLPLPDNSVVMLKGQTITPDAINQNRAEITLPAAAESGKLYVVARGKSSAAVWFTISEDSMLSYDPTKLIIDNGIKYVGNYLLFKLSPANNTVANARLVAAAMSTELVGQMPSLRLYQVAISASNYSGLMAKFTALESQALVEYAVVDFLDNNESIDWSWDPAIGGQRDRNNVEEGAALYASRASSAEQPLTPMFMAMGVSEQGIDYSLADFLAYLNNDPSVSNTQIFALDKNIAAGGSHGSNVTGLVAAKLGNGGNAGLLSALNNNHGGASILVSGGSVYERINNSLNMAKAGVGVINWSWGVHRVIRNAENAIINGAKNCAGETVLVNTIEEFDFGSLKSVVSDFFNVLASNHPNVVVVSSAGNAATSAGDLTNRLPTAINHPQYIVVGAHTSGGRYVDGSLEDEAAVTRYPTSCFNSSWPVDIVRAPYSNFGDRVDISASGSITGHENTLLASVRGTSFAAPMVSSTVALMQSINPNLSPAEIKSMLRRSAMPLFNRVELSGQTDSENVVTRALTAAENPSHAGSGARLNVKGALELALQSYDLGTVTRGDVLTVKVPADGEVTRTIDFTIPGEGSVFDRVDIMFLVDVSGSYSNDMVTFRTRAPDIMNAFLSTGSNVNIGLASFSDFPVSPFGVSYDYAFRLDQALTSNTDDVITALNKLTILSGNDAPESQLEALFQTAQPETGWRLGSLPIIFLATDASFHNSDTNPAYPGTGYTQTLNTLETKGIKVFGLQSGGDVADVLKITSATGGAAYSLSGNSAEIVEAVLSAVESSNRDLDINLEAFGDFNKLVSKIVPHAVPGAQPGDAIKNVNPGDTVSFDVTFKADALEDARNRKFSFRLRVTANGVAIIHEIPVIIEIE